MTTRILAANRTHRALVKAAVLALLPLATDEPGDLIIYRGRRDIAGDRVGWDQLTDSDKAACLAIARPVVDAVETLYREQGVAADKGGES